MKPRNREAGSIMVVFAFLIPVILLVIVLLIEVGRYQTTVMHLENATDAAAVAGLGKVSEIILTADTDAAADPSLIYSFANDAVARQFERLGFYIPDDNNAIHFDGQSIYLTATTTEEMQFHSYIPGLDHVLGSSAVQAYSMATMDYDNGNLVFRTTDQEQIVEQVPWAIHNSELHDLADGNGHDYYELAALPGGKFQVGQEYVLKCGSYYEGNDATDQDQWHTTDLDHDGWYDDDLNRDGFHDDDVEQEDDNGSYAIPGTSNKTYPWEDPTRYTVTNMLYIPMDEGDQTVEGAGDGFVKAYGVVFQALATGESSYWFMGVDGGSFAVPNTPANVALLTAAGVAYEAIGAGAGRTVTVRPDGTCATAVDATKSDFTYDTAIQLINQPKVIVYSSDIIDPVTEVLGRAGINAYTDWDFIDADGAYPRTVDINNDGQMETYNSLYEALSGHDWIHLHHEDFMATEQGKTNAVDIEKYVSEGGYMYCQCLAAKTLDQALEAKGATTMAYTNPIPGNTLLQNGNYGPLDNAMTNNFYLQDANGDPLQYFPLDQNYYGFGLDAAGAVDATDAVLGFSGAFKSMNPEFIDESKNLTLVARYDPGADPNSIWNESGWKTGNMQLVEKDLNLDMTNDGDKKDTLDLDTLYANRAAYGWSGFIQQQAVQRWVPEHTETRTTTTVIGHVCKKSGCSSPSLCNNASHSSKWKANVYATETVTVPGQYVTDYYEYKLDTNKDGDYNDVGTGASGYVKELCGLHGKGFFTYSTGHNPADLAFDRQILNNLLISGARGRQGFFGVIDLDGTDPEEGAVFYRNNAWMGFYDSQNAEHRFLDKGDILLAEPGNMAGPTNKAVMYRYNTDLDNDLPVDEHELGSGRVIQVPIVEMVTGTYATMYDMPTDASDADRALRVVGTARFFVRDMVHETALRSELGPVKPGQVRGIFIGYDLEP